MKDHCYQRLFTFSLLTLGLMACESIEPIAFKRFLSLKPNLLTPLLV